MDAKIFGAFIAQCRKEKNMTQADLFLEIQAIEKRPRKKKEISLSEIVYLLEMDYNDTDKIKIREILRW